MTRSTEFLNGILNRKSVVIKNSTVSILPNPVTTSKISLSGVPFERKLLNAILNRSVS